MADEANAPEAKAAENAEGSKGGLEGVIGGKRERRRIKAKVKHKSSLIRAADAAFDPARVRVVGGDSDEMAEVDPPAIIIEKNGDQIVKILVKCPCGRHAELVCEYEE